VAFAIIDDKSELRRYTRYVRDGAGFRWLLGAVLISIPENKEMQK
jgi:hypothetical protein